jgi:DNA-binding GntR family transcriptional regulator
VQEGAHLKTEEHLSYAFNISKNTTYRAIKELVAEGILFSQQGGGVYVARNAKEIIRRNKIDDFISEDLIPTIKIAKFLGMSNYEIITKIEKEFEENN